MKKSVGFCLVTIILGCGTKQEKKIEKEVMVTEKELLLPLAGDSGYILKEDVDSFLHSHCLTDTTDGWDAYKSNDTIGKFYFYRNTAHFIACISNPSTHNQSPLLLEIDVTGKLLKSEQYGYAPRGCDRDFNNGFVKYGDYFGIIMCGTGTGFYCESLYLMKNIIPEEGQNDIPINYWLSERDTIRQISSTIEWKKDSLVIHYKLEQGPEEEVSRDIIVKKTKNFKIKYTFKNEAWQASDSTWLHEFMY